MQNSKLFCLRPQPTMLLGPERRAPAARCTAGRGCSGRGRGHGHLGPVSTALAYCAALLECLCPAPGTTRPCLASGATTETGRTCSRTSGPGPSPTANTHTAPADLSGPAMCITPGQAHPLCAWRSIQEQAPGQSRCVISHLQRPAKPTGCTFWLLTERVLSASDEGNQSPRDPHTHLAIFL